MPLPLTPTACGKLEGLDMLSVTEPAFARIVVTLNLRPVLAAESL